jgi:hypothetical protein
MIHETPGNRILPDVLQFLLQLLSMPYDVVETFIAPDRAFIFEHLIYCPRRPPLDALKHRGQFVGFNQSEDLDAHGQA